MWKDWPHTDNAAFYDNTLQQRSNGLAKSLGLGENEEFVDEFHKGLKQLYEELGKIKDGVEKSVQTSETLKPLKDK